MFFARLLLAITLISSNCLAPLAYANTGNSVPPAVNSAQLLSMLKAFKFTDSTGARMSIEHVLSLTQNKPYKEVIELLISRVNGHLIEMKTTKGSLSEYYKTIEYIVSALAIIAPASYYEKVFALTENVIDIAEKDTATKIDLHALTNKFDDAEEIIKANTKLKLLSLDAPVQQAAPVFEADVKTELANYEASLNKEIKGQPEVVEALVNIRRRDLIYGYRKEPAVAWFLGLPGTGKDTSARAYTNSYFKSPVAFEKHMFTVYPLIGKADIWTYMGSSTGYVGSEGFPPFLDFLVKHSGGKYIKEEAGTDRDGKATYRIILNESWKEGDVFEGYYPPESAVVYLDEFHAWAKNLKDLFIKKALEPNGGFVINNPNGGLDKIQVPVTFFIGSNDGIELVASREKNGQRFGKPMTFEEMIERHSRAAKNTVAIKNAIMAGNGAVNESSSGSEGARGTSEELLNRIPVFLLMRPLPPVELQAIADNKIRARLDNLAKSRSGFNKIKITYSKALLEFIQSYQYVAEDSARALDQKISEMIEVPLFEAFSQGLIKKNSAVTLQLEIVQNADKTYSLSLQIDGQKPQAVAIKATEGEKQKAPISDARLDELDQLEGRLNQHVVGQENVVKQVARAVKLSEEGRQGVVKVEDAKEAARAYMLLGLSSTGKSQLGKAVGQELLGSADSTLTIQFTPDMSGQDIRAKLIGLKDGHGNPIPSDFMKHYDRNGGRVVVMLDEIANVRDKEILNMLYDLIREPVVTTFSDSVPRAMSNVTFLITGNAGQELYTDLPPNLPEVVRRAALTEIHRKSAGNPNLRREILSKYFSEAFINRVGEDRIFDFSPLGYLAASQLVQLKMESSIADLKPKEGRRGWNINFRSEKAYRQIIDGIEREGFIAREQGASIDHFVTKKFKDGLREALLAQRVPSDAKVILDFVKIEKRDDGDGLDEASDRNVIVISVEVDNGQKFELQLDGKQLISAPAELKSDLIVTAYHEAGHELVRATYLKDFFQPKGIKVIPGVAHIGGKWVHYAGVASTMKRVQTQLTREYLVREIAVLLGGFIAEDLIIEGGYSSHGKQNDIERATHLAELGILQLGLSETWGVRNADKATLSEVEKVLLADEVKKLFDEAKKLATEAILANAKTFEALGNQLANKGLMSGEEIEATYAKVGLLVETDSSFDTAAKAGEAKHKKPAVTARKGLKYKFASTFQILPESTVVDIVAQLEAERAAEIAKLQVSPKIQFLNAFESKAPVAAAKPATDASCDSLLVQPKK
jgi:ATP-dependent Clp protease ATP-binding subunit ClpA